MSATAARQPLRATPAIAHTVARRGMEQRFEAVRARVERSGLPGFDSRLSAAETELRYGRLNACADKLDKIEHQLVEQVAADQVSAGLIETVALNAARGETQERNEGGDVVLVDRDGLLWAKRKGKLTGAALTAAEKFRGLHYTAHKSEVRIAPQGGGGGGGAFAGFTPHAAQVEAMMTLAKAKEEAFNNDQVLVWLVEAVCGRGETLRDLAKGDKHLAAKLETELQVACRLLARHWKLG